MVRNKGWIKDSQKHAMAAKGIKTKLLTEKKTIYISNNEYIHPDLRQKDKKYERIDIQLLDTKTKKWIINEIERLKNELGKNFDLVDANLYSVTKNYKAYELKFTSHDDNISVIIWLKWSDYRDNNYKFYVSPNREYYIQTLAGHKIRTTVTKIKNMMKEKI